MSVLGFFRPETKDFEVTVRCHAEDGTCLGSRMITVSAKNSGHAMGLAKGVARQDLSVFSAYSLEVREVVYT